MALFRDHQGDFFEIPAEELERFKVRGELPEGAEAGGVEAGPMQPAYFWDRGASPEKGVEAVEGGTGDPHAVVPRYYWETGKGLRAVPAGAAHNYPAVSQAAVPPAYVYPEAVRPDVVRPAYFWDRPAAAYNYEPPGDAAAYNYEGPAKG